MANYKNDTPMTNKTDGDFTTRHHQKNHIKSYHEIMPSLE